MNAKEQSKTYRILKIYEKLSAGDGIVRKEMADYFDVSKKTIKRDIKAINTYFQDINNDFQNEYIKYDYQRSAYFLNDKKIKLSQKEILAVVKVLLESRAFCREESENIINKLIKRVPLNLQTDIKDLIANELYHYSELEHKTKLLDLIWDLSLAIKEKRVLEIKYCPLNKENYVERKIEPLGLMFSEYYFYLIAHHYRQQDDFKIVYRLDRLKEINMSSDHFTHCYTDRFQEGEFRKRIQFMYPGKLIKIKFKFWGASIEAVLDRLPTAEIIEIKNDEYIVEAEVFGTGIKMWLLSQGAKLEVLEPKELREELKNTISMMMVNY